MDPHPSCAVGVVRTTRVAAAGRRRTNVMQGRTPVCLGDHRVAATDDNTNGANAGGTNPVGRAEGAMAALACSRAAAAQPLTAVP